MTLKECVENHKKLWMWMAKKAKEGNIYVTKRIYFLDQEIDDIPKNDCFACEYAFQEFLRSKSLLLRHKSGSVCSFCPFQWLDPDRQNNSKIPCSEVGSPYQMRYQKMMDNFRVGSEFGIEDCSQICEEIANIPLKKGLRDKLERT